jgi:hypothetical protein
MTCEYFQVALQQTDSLEWQDFKKDNKGNKQDQNLTL